MATTIQNIELPKKPRARDTSNGWQVIGPDLNTEANPTSVVNESNTVSSISWGTTFIALESSVVSDGSYSMKFTASSNGNRTYVDLSAAPYSLTVGKRYRISIDSRHAGSGDDFILQFNKTTAFNDGDPQTLIQTITSSDTAFVTYTQDIVFDADTYKYFGIKENGTNDNASGYLDNFTIYEMENFSNNNHGEIYSGRGLEFDGVTDHLTTPLGNLDASASTSWAKGSIGSDNIVTNATGREVPLKLTSCVWVRLNAVGKSQFIQESGGGEWGIKVESSNKITVNYLTDNYGVDSSNDSASATGTKVLETNTWYRVVVNYNMQEGTAADVFQIYINGVLDPLSTSSELGSTGIRAYKRISPDHSLRIGSYGNGESSLLDGAFSDYQVWFGNFTADDAAYDYANPESLALNASGSALTEGNLKLWYPMQDGHRGQQSYILDGANTGLGVDIVVNGDFSTSGTLATNSQSLGWSLGNADDQGVSITNGELVLNKSGEDSNYARVYATNGSSTSLMTIGQSYKLTYTVSEVTGTPNLLYYNGGYVGGLGETVGTHSYVFTQHTSALFILKNNTTGTTIKLSNVSVKAINDKHHATTVFYGDELWNKADNDVATWVATAATSVASSEVAIGGTTDGVKLIYGSQGGNHSSYAQFSSSKFLSEDLVVGREYTVSGLFATDVAGNTNAPGVAVYASGFKYPTGFASAAANIIPATNLQTNGTMEADSDWIDWGSPSTGSVRSTAQVHNGTYSRKFTASGTDDGIAGNGDGTFTTVAGTTYLVSFWIYPDDGTVCLVKNRKGGIGEIGATKTVTGLTENAWNKVEMQFTEDVGGTAAYIIITSSTQTSGDFYVDDVVVTAFVDREITFTATNTTGDYLAALNIPSTTANDLISQIDDKNSIFDESSINSSSGWQSYVGSGGTSVVSYDATDDEVTFSTTTNGAIEGMKLEDENYTALEIGRTYTVKINMRAASGTPTVKVRLGVGNIVTDAITTSDVDYNFSVTPVNITSSLLVYLQDTSGIDITVSKVEIFPHCNLYVDDLSFKEVGVASGWTDADQQLHIPQTALQSYNELAWFDGTIASDAYVDLDSAITTSGNSWSLSFWVFHDDNGHDYDIILGDGSNQFITLNNNTTDRLSYRDSSNTYHTISDAAIPESEWVHITITATANASITSYVNGVAQATNSDMTNTTLLLERFMRGYSNANYLTLGTINEISYYSDVLTSAEALDLFNDGKAKSALEASGSAGLVGYWRNNGLSTWTDLKGSNNGTVTASETILIPEGVDTTRDAQGFLMNKKRSTGSLNFPVDKSSQTPSLDTGSYVEVNDHSGLTFGTGNFSMECWVKPSYRSKGSSSLNTIFTLGGQINDSDSAGFCTSSGSILAYIGGVSMSEGYSTNNWHHVVATREGLGSGEMKLYVNGDEEATGTSNTNLNNAHNMTIGVDENRTRGYEEAVDSIKVYNRALDSTEVLKNYKATKGSHEN